MEDKLVGYMIGALEIEEILLVEQALEADPAVVQQLEVLRLAIEPLQYAAEPVDPPVDLAARTCQRIRELR